MMDDCLFCKIVAGEIPCDKVEENDSFLAFRDIDPQAPTHILVIPKTHVRSLAEADDAEMLGGQTIEQCAVAFDSCQNLLVSLGGLGNLRERGIG